MLLLNSFLEGVGGFIGFIFSIFILVFITSLIGRWTNTTFVYRGGTKITPFKTPKERQVQKEEEIREQKIRNQNLYRTKELNEFCREFGKSTEEYGHLIDSMTLGTSTGDFLGILSQAAEVIDQNGNTEFVINFYAKIKLAKKREELNFDQYFNLGKEVYTRAKNEINLL